jgi:hypothetical protein
MDDFFKTLRDTPFDIHEHNPQPRGFTFKSSHTEESKKLISEMKKGLKQTPEHIKKRVDKMVGFKQSTHQKEKAKEMFQSEWSVTDPNGKLHKVINLRQFCRDNKLDQGNMVKVSQGILKQHKGWKCIKLGA